MNFLICRDFSRFFPNFSKFLIKFSGFFRYKNSFFLLKIDFSKFYKRTGNVAQSRVSDQSQSTIKSKM